MDKSKKNVLIIADGRIAKHFLSHIVSHYTFENNYYIIYYDEKVLPMVTTDSTRLYRFDPTSFVKLSKVFDKIDFLDIFIVMANKVDTMGVYENVRRLDSKGHIVIFDRWHLDIQDTHTTILNSKELITLRLSDFLPNIPIIAKNIGVGKGEILEVLVPAGSSYVYRHIGSIEQNNWQIVALYRKGELHLVRPNLMIFPNDKLILVGKPDILRNVYLSIKKELGQFPSPYGQNIYLLIDMAYQNVEAIERLVYNSAHLHQNLQNQHLYIKVINANNIAKLRFIKSFSSDTIDVLIDYKENNSYNFLIEESEEYKIGLFILSSKLLLDKYILNKFYELKKPLLSFADNVSISKLRSIGLTIDYTKNIEEITPAIFDISSQLELKLELFENSLISFNQKRLLLQHFENLASIYGKKLYYISSEDNPLMFLRYKKETLNVVPFSKKVNQGDLFKFLSTDLDSFYTNLDSIHQLYLPFEG